MPVTIPAPCMDLMDEFEQKAEQAAEAAKALRSAQNQLLAAQDAVGYWTPRVVESHEQAIAAAEAFIECLRADQPPTPAGVKHK